MHTEGFCAHCGPPAAGALFATSAPRPRSPDCFADGACSHGLAARHGAALAKELARSGRRPPPRPGQQRAGYHLRWLRLLHQHDHQRGRRRQHAPGARPRAPPRADGRYESQNGGVLLDVRKRAEALL